MALAVGMWWVFDRTRSGFILCLILTFLLASITQFLFKYKITRYDPYTDMMGGGDFPNSIIVLLWQSFSRKIFYMVLSLVMNYIISSLTKIQFLMYLLHAGILWEVNFYIQGLGQFTSQRVYCLALSDDGCSN